MGMSRVVECAEGAPNWNRIRAEILRLGSTPEMRMIDGQLAFPDEEPPANWTEIRISIRGHMVTIKRSRSVVELVTWGSNDPHQEQAATIVADAIRSAIIPSPPM